MIGSLASSVNNSHGSCQQQQSQSSGIHLSATSMSLSAYAPNIMGNLSGMTLRHVGQIRQLEDAEQLAVEQEDFEAAANLSTELDGLR